MKKIIFGILATVAGVAALFSYRTSLDLAPAPAPVSGGQTSGSRTLTDGSYTGAAANTRYGPVQVQITVSGGKVTAVDVPTHPDSNGTDQRINSAAIPRLVSETLAAQSSHVDMVSGATFTSSGYVQSLQSALDQATR